MTAPLLCVHPRLTTNFLHERKYHLVNHIAILILLSRFDFKCFWVGQVKPWIFEAYKGPIRVDEWHIVWTLFCYGGLRSQQGFSISLQQWQWPGCRFRNVQSSVLTESRKPGRRWCYACSTERKSIFFTVSGYSLNTYIDVTYKFLWRALDSIISGRKARRLCADDEKSVQRHFAVIRHHS